MVFSSLVFLFIFLPVVIIGYYLIRIDLKNLFLLVASLFFYAWGEPRYIVLIIFSIILNYSMAFFISRKFRNKLINQFTLIVAVALNVLMLVYYKYAGFFIVNLTDWIGLEYEYSAIALPIGISFYTFQGISYLVDIYRNESKPQKNIIDLALYISFFPQLVAGPIVRYEDIAQQLRFRRENFDKFSQGVRQFIVGLAKKILIANQLGLVADEIFLTNSQQLSLSLAWLGIIAYTLQIYFDFSGYSEMAIGLGKMFGFQLPANFNYPYIAKSVTEFWRRWHITLGAWFRDYIYIPLGGNRKGTWRFVGNILIVWSLTGFWHGASWNFIIWGLYFGTIITLERFGLGKVLSKMWTPLQHFYLLFVIMIGWVLFRVENLSKAKDYLGAMFGANSFSIIDEQTLFYLNDYWMYFLIAIICSMPIGRMILASFKARAGVTVSNLGDIVITIFVLVLFYLSIVYLTSSTFNPFIYFRF